MGETNTGKPGGTIVVRIDPDLKELIPNYLNNRQKDIQAMRAALDKKDFETIRTLGHSMKGSGGGYGFDAISQIGHDLEEAGVEKKPEAIMKSIGELENYLSRVEVVSE